MCFEKMLWDILEKVNGRTLQIFANVWSAPHGNLLVGISGSSRNKRNLLSKQKCVLRKCCGINQKW